MNHHKQSTVRKWAIAPPLATAAVLLGGTAASASPLDSTPAAAPPGCLPAYVCHWSGVNYLGPAWNHDSVPSGECVAIDHTLSVYNNSSRYARFWEYTYKSPDGVTRCGGQNKLIAPGGSSKNLVFIAYGLGGR